MKKKNIVSLAIIACLLIFNACERTVKKYFDSNPTTVEKTEITSLKTSDTDKTEASSAESESDDSSLNCTWLYQKAGGQTINNVRAEDPTVADKVTTFTTNGIKAEFSWTGPAAVGRSAGHSGNTFVLTDNKAGDNPNGYSDLWEIGFSVCPQTAEYDSDDYQKIRKFTEADGVYKIELFDDGARFFIVYSSKTSAWHEWPAVRSWWYDENTNCVYTFLVAKNTENQADLTEAEINEIITMIQSLSVKVISK